ncbi:MAG: nitroreductase family deazaflavin-dependent oxidoreductase [Acidimicrobiia bacterium]|nr:nitroreductase family deazaflavin-dependent oxidoreductase [Acidimicrobiia bacterium]
MAVGRAPHSHQSGRTLLVRLLTLRDDGAMYRAFEKRFVPAIVNRSRLALFLLKVPKWLYRTPLNRWMKRHVLLLTTKGRRSGKPHTVALDYFEVDGITHVLAGWKGDTDWCKNLRAHPEVTVQIGADVTRRRAVELIGLEKESILDLVRSEMPNLVEFVDPEDAVFRLDPV